MATFYPNQIDTAVSLPPAVDNFTPIRAAVVNNLRDAILKIESNLGVDPAGMYGTVVARLTTLEHAVVSSYTGGISFFGDLSGTNISQTVIGLQGNSVSSATPNNGDVLTWNAGLSQWHPQPGGGGGGSNATALQGFPISSTTPTSGQFLGWNGTNWISAPVPSGFTAGGDLSGSSSSQTVIGLQGHPVSAATPTLSQILQYNGASWVPTVPVSSVRQITTSTFTMSTDQVLAVGVISAPLTITLPASPVLGTTFIIKDAAGSLPNSSSYQPPGVPSQSIYIAVNGNGNDIDNVTTYYLTVKYESITLIWNTSIAGSSWMVC